MAVQTSETMKNKRVKLLDGTRTKIIGALATNYKLEDGSKLPARKLLQKGKGYVETDLTMRDLEDSGMGFVVQDQDEVVAPKKTKKVVKEEKPLTRKQKREALAEAAANKVKEERKAKKAALAKKKAKKAAKLEAEAEAEVATTKKSKAKSKKSASAGTKQSEKSGAETPKVKRSELDFKNSDRLNKIRKHVTDILKDHMVTHYTNIEDVVSEASIFSEDSDRGELRMQILIKLPQPEHHSLDYYLAIAKLAGANLKTPKESLQIKLAQRLDLADEDIEVTPGDILDDEEGNRYIFAGIIGKQFAFVDVENEQVVTGGFSFFEGLDYLSDFATVMGEGLEDVNARPSELEEADPSLDDDLDIDELDPLSSIEDWTTMERDSMVEMLVSNYSREDVLEFIEQHEDLDLEDGDEDKETQVLFEDIVDYMRGEQEDEDFEDDEKEVEGEVDDADMRSALIEDNHLTMEIAALLTEQQILDLYNTHYETEEVEDEEEEVEEKEYSLEEKRAILVDAGEVSSSVAGILSEEQVVTMFDGLEVLDTADQDEEVEDDIEDDADMEEVEGDDEIEDDEEEVEGDDEIEDDEEEVEGDEVIDDEDDLEFDLEDDK